MTDKKAREILLKAIDYCGGVTNMAPYLGMSQCLLSHHKNKQIDERYDRLPLRFAVKVERITNGRFKASDLAQVTYSFLPKAD